MLPKVTILGAGPAGFALAADLSRNGTSVLLYSHPLHTTHASCVLQKGSLLTSKGVISGTTLLRITTSITDAVAFSNFLFLTVPSTGHQTILDELRQFELWDHTIISIPGNMFSLIANKEMEVGNIFETNISPYSCRMNEGVLHVMGKKQSFNIASLRKDIPPALKKRIERIFPQELIWSHNVIEVCLSNINGVFHPLMMLMNAGRIESTGGDFLLYRDGLTRSVANAMLAVDRVRLAVGDAFGFQLDSVIETSNLCYSASFTDLVDLGRNSEPHNKLKAPVSIDNRNISEDVPDLLVCWMELAEKLGIDASPIKGVVLMASMVMGIDYSEEGRNLKRLHLDGLSRDELLLRFCV